MKTLILTWAIMALAASLKVDEWFIYIPAIFIGITLLNLYHSKWFKNKTKDD
jgi:hypothetical protein